MSTRSDFFLRLLRYAHTLLATALTLFLVFILANAFLLTSFTVEGHSMDPTLHNGELLFIDLTRYHLISPQKGDIVIVAYAGDRRVHFVKRITGLPGDTVSVQGAPLTLGKDQYFVTGDNAPHSTDSRTFGPVARDQIIGKVVYPAE